MSYIKKYRVFCNTENEYIDTWMFKKPTLCPRDTRHVIDHAETRLIEQDNTAGDNFNASINSQGELEVALPRTAFGQVTMAQETPEVQVDYRYGVLADSATTSATGAGSHSASNSMMYIDTGSASDSSSTVETVRYIRYATGQGAKCCFTAVFTPGVAGSTQIIGCGNSNEGYFFGYNGADFGVMIRRDAVDTWIPSSDWNGDRMDGSGPSKQVMDTSVGNVFQIQFQWLGFGAVRYFVENTVSGHFQQVHAIHYANSNTLPSTLNPSFPVTAHVENTTNNSSVVLATSSMYAAVEGKRELLGPTFAIDNIKVADSITDIQNMLTIHSKNTFHSHPNYTPVMLRSLNIASEGTKSAVIYLIRNATVAGTQTWTDVDTDLSVIEYDTDGTSLTGGVILLMSVIQPNDSTQFDLTALKIEMQRNTSISVGTRLSGNGSNDITLSLLWQEDR